MQDLRSFPGGSSRLFGGGGGVIGNGAGVDRKQRAHAQQNLKCPRCDSLNTKFCYYNNYNLSQPRHFCKSCRRYWTKGGVLRNVPVGGGCRKSKRSSAASSKPSKSSLEYTGINHHSRSSGASRSSSDSSSLTAASYNPDPSPSFDPSPPGLVLDQSIDQVGTAEIFPETGSFGNLISASSSTPAMGLNFTDQFPFRSPAEQGIPAEEQLKMEGIPAGYIMDQTAPMDLAPPTLSRNMCGGGFDWSGSVDPTAGLFDLTSSVDQGWFWNQSQWGQDDPTIYLP